MSLIRAVCIALILAAMPSAPRAQSMDDRIILPPVPPVDPSEIWQNVPADSAGGQDSTAATEEKIDLEDVVIYGRDRYRVAPGTKLSTAFTGHAMPPNRPFVRQRDNLYYQLPHVENKFLLSRDWQLRDRPLSKAYLSYGAWNAMHAQLIAGKQNFLLKTNQLVDLFIDFGHEHTYGHEKDDFHHYFHRSDRIKGSCLYQIENNVETQTYLAIESGRYNMPNVFKRRDAADYRLGTVLNAYKGDYANASIYLDFSTGSVADTNRVSYTASHARAEGALRYRTLFLNGSIDYTDYGLVLPDYPDMPDSSKLKTKLVVMEAWAEGYRFYRNWFTATGGLRLGLFKNHLYGSEAQPVIHPRLDVRYVGTPNLEVALAYEPELSFATYRDRFLANPYLSQNAETAPLNKYVNLSLSGEYRYDGLGSASTSVGYERIINYPRYHYRSGTGLYDLTLRPDSVFSSDVVTVTRFVFTLRSAEVFGTLFEGTFRLTAPAFDGSGAAVPFFPRYRFGLAAAGKWVYDVEQRYHLYHVAEQHYGPGADETMPGYTVLDFAFTRNINEYFKLFTEGFFAQHGVSRSWYGYTDPVFSMAMGVRYRW